MIDCKTCEYAKVLCVVERDRQTKAISTIPYGKVECSSPKYGKRKYTVNDSRENCSFYKKRERLREGDKINEQ